MAITFTNFFTVNVNGSLETVNGNLGSVNGNLGPVNGNLGALKKYQFPVIVGKLLFLPQTAICCFLY